ASPVNDPCLGGRPQRPKECVWPLPRHPDVPQTFHGNLRSLHGVAPRLAHSRCIECLVSYSGRYWPDGWRHRNVVVDRIAWKRGRKEPVCYRCLVDRTDDAGLQPGSVTGESIVHTMDHRADGGTFSLDWWRGTDRSDVGMVGPANQESGCSLGDSW